MTRNYAIRPFAILCLAVALALPGGAGAEVVPTSAAEIKLTFAPVVERAAPAVVNIYTRRIVRQRRVNPLFDDPFFRHFFGDQFGFGAPQERVQRSLGSGVIIDGDAGTVITNHHVIEGADEVVVVLNDRREFPATIVGTDERSDLAVLRIEGVGAPLPSLPLGRSDDLEVGDLVLAIGNPFGVGQTVTMGIVSALARTTVGISDYRSFIQTDAAINPGNSGGALVNVRGELVGINTAIYSKSGGSEGIGFATPVEMVQAVARGILSDGRTVRPWLGVQGQPVTPDMAAALGLERPRGLLVNGLYPGGPADKAGLRIGDVVVAVDGRPVDDPEALRFRIATLAVGEEARLTVLRKGRETVVEVPLVPPTEEPPRNVTEIGGRTPLAGSVVANLNPALAEELGIAATRPGVIVLRVRRGGLAQRLNIRPGDRVLEVNGHRIGRVRDLQAALDRPPRDGWRIKLEREGEVVTLVIGR